MKTASECVKAFCEMSNVSKYYDSTYSVGLIPIEYGNKNLFAVLYVNNDKGYFPLAIRSYYDGKLGEYIGVVYNHSLEDREEFFDMVTEYVKSFGYEFDCETEEDIHNQPTYVDWYKFCIESDDNSNKEALV